MSMFTKILRFFNSYFFKAYQRLSTVSLGVVSIVPNSEISPQDLINAADKALYIAKQQGRDQVHAVGVFTPS